MIHIVGCIFSGSFCTFVSRWALWSCCWPGTEPHKAQGLDPASHRPPCCFQHRSNLRQRTEWGPKRKERKYLCLSASLVKALTCELIRASVGRQCLSSPYGCGKTHNPPVYTHVSGWWAADCVCSGSPRWCRGPSSSLRPAPRWVCSRPGSLDRSTAGPGSGGGQEWQEGEIQLWNEQQSTQWKGKNLGNSSWQNNLITRSIRAALEITVLLIRRKLLLPGQK